MFRWIIFYVALTLNTALFAKEWKSLKAYQKNTQKEILTPSDWLKKDRFDNSEVWHQVNAFNLENNLPQEYSNILQRRDFYEWLYNELDIKGHTIVWVDMAHFISRKIHLMEVFPYSVFSKKAIKDYAKQGSEAVFNNAFGELQNLYNSQIILEIEKAMKWDNDILYKEQYLWLERIYNTMDAKSLKTLERIAKRKCLYGLIVPKVIEFEGGLSNPEARYNYALKVLKPYCERIYQ